MERFRYPTRKEIRISLTADIKEMKKTNCLNSKEMRLDNRCQTVTYLLKLLKSHAIVGSQPVPFGARTEEM
jgi:hypothetical protein